MPRKTTCFRSGQRRTMSVGKCVWSSIAIGQPARSRGRSAALMSGSRLIATGMSSGRSSRSVTAASDGFASTKIARIVFLFLSPRARHRSEDGRCS